MARFGSPGALQQLLPDSSLKTGRGSLQLSPSQEEDFFRPSSREEAQQLWEAEKIKIRQVLDKQQKQMVEDSQWLRREERSLVSRPPHRTPPPLCSCPLGNSIPLELSILSTLESKSFALVSSAGPYGLYE